MYDLSSLSLDTLLAIAKDAALVDCRRQTEWVVVLALPGHELVMNHGNARIFLQGLIYGASAGDEETSALIESTVTKNGASPERIMLE